MLEIKRTIVSFDKQNMSYCRQLLQIFLGKEALRFPQNLYLTKFHVLSCYRQRGFNSRLGAPNTIKRFIRYNKQLYWFSKILLMKYRNLSIDRLSPSPSLCKVFSLLQLNCETGSHCLYQYQFLTKRQLASHLAKSESRSLPKKGGGIGVIPYT